jgi:ribosomal protein L11 methyltransferase
MDHAVCPPADRLRCGPALQEAQESREFVPTAKRIGKQNDKATQSEDLVHALCHYCLSPGFQLNLGLYHIEVGGSLSAHRQLARHAALTTCGKSCRNFVQKPVDISVAHDVDSMRERLYLVGQKPQPWWILPTFVLNSLNNSKKFRESMPSKARKTGDVWVAQIETDEQRAHILSAFICDQIGTADTAISLVDKGRGRWQLAIHFAGTPGKEAMRSLIATAAGAAAAKQLRFSRCATKDWVAASLAGLMPIRAGRFLIHGAHDRAHVPPNRIGIEIEAALAFGTGHHGTTRGCLLALDSLCKGLGKGRRRSARTHPKAGAKRPLSKRLQTLDLGTGSGVLAIAAARALRQPVLATDIDAEAVRIARANARLNRAGIMVEVLRADGLASHRLHGRTPFDLILANILLDPLKRLATPVAKLAGPGARVILSGLLSSQANALVAAYHPLALDRRIDVEGWTTLVFARRVRPHPAVARRRRRS